MISFLKELILCMNKESWYAQDDSINSQIGGNQTKSKLDLYCTPHWGAKSAHMGL